MHYKSMLSATTLLVGLLSIPVCGQAQQAAASEVKADPAAVAMLGEAHDKRDTFAAGFSGLSAKLTINDNGKEFKGTFSYKGPGNNFDLILQGASTEETTWAKEQLGSAFMHRQPDDFTKGDGKNALTFGADDSNPLGRAIAFNDKGKTMYRVKDGHITQVNRSMGPTMRFSITILSDRNLPGGKYLPSQFTVTYLDSSTGAIKQVDMFSDRFTKLGNSMVPSSRRVVTLDNSGFVTRSFLLEDIKALEPTTASK